MENNLVLSIFPGIDLLGMAFEEAGFCIVRGPDVLWGGDVRRFHPPAGRFDGVIGGPPCQMFSQLRHLNGTAGQKHSNLIPEFERVVSEAAPAWFLMENVPAAPKPVIANYCVTSMTLNNRWVGGIQNRERCFSFGVCAAHPVDLAAYLDVVLFEPAEWGYAVTSSSRQVPVEIGGTGKIKRTYTENGKRRGPNAGPRAAIADMCQLQGLPANFLDEAPFSEAGKRKMIGNGVPLPLGRAIANAVREALAVYGAAGG